MTAAEWAGATPRRWQVEALEASWAAIQAQEPTLVEAVMGAGKSRLIAELAARAAAQGWRVVVSTPTVALVAQLGATLRERLPAGHVGEYYTDAHDVGQPVTVTCYPSVGALMSADPRPVDLWLCDEAHRTESAREQAAYQVMQPVRRLALSATPYLSSGGTLSLWHRLAYRYPLGAALRDGVLVPWDVLGWDGPRSDIDEAMTALIKRSAGPGVVDARSIEDAEEYATVLCAAGIPARPIHSKQPAKERALYLSMLQRGDLRALVHVSMLVEGVDLPWLRWLGLRRRVGSRVRFLQQLGRVLRTSPGKARALVLDPWGLMEQHDLEYAAALGGAYDDPAESVSDETPKDEQEWDLIDLPPLSTDPLMVPGRTARRAVAAWARRALHLATEAGIREPSEWEADGAWRRRMAAEKQREALSRMAWALRFAGVPALKAGVKALLGMADALTAGAVSDLLDVLHASADYGTTHKRGWSPRPDGLTLPPLPQRVTRGLGAPQFPAEAK